MDPVVHFEMAMENMARGKKFYESVFDLKFDDVPQMYYAIAHSTESEKSGLPIKPGRINGGFTDRKIDNINPIIVIKVQDIMKSLEKAKKEGAKIVREQMQVGEMGLYARITDSEGNVIGVWQDLK